MPRIQSSDAAAMLPPASPLATLSARLTATAQGLQLGTEVRPVAVAPDFVVRAKTTQTRSIAGQAQSAARVWWMSGRPRRANIAWALGRRNRNRCRRRDDCEMTGHGVIFKGGRKIPGIRGLSSRFHAPGDLWYLPRSARPPSPARSIPAMRSPWPMGFAASLPEPFRKLQPQSLDRSSRRLRLFRGTAAAAYRLAAADPLLGAPSNPSGPRPSGRGARSGGSRSSVFLDTLGAVPIDRDALAALTDLPRSW